MGMTVPIAHESGAARRRPAEHRIVSPHLAGGPPGECTQSSEAHLAGSPTTQRSPRVPRPLRHGAGIHNLDRFGDGGGSSTTPAPQSTRATQLLVDNRLRLSHVSQVRRPVRPVCKLQRIRVQTRNPRSRRPAPALGGSRCGKTPPRGLPAIRKISSRNLEAPRPTSGRFRAPERFTRPDSKANLSPDHVAVPIEKREDPTTSR